MIYLYAVRKFHTRKVLKQKRGKKNIYRRRSCCINRPDDTKQCNAVRMQTRRMLRVASAARSSPRSYIEQIRANNLRWSFLYKSKYSGVAIIKDKTNDFYCIAASLRIYRQGRPGGSARFLHCGIAACVNLLAIYPTHEYY